MTEDHVDVRNGAALSDRLGLLSLCALPRRFASTAPSFLGTIRPVCLQDLGHPGGATGRPFLKDRRMPNVGRGSDE